ncbi:MAG: T9SS type A sorting domain-containing protein [Chitinophagales bacterium]
MEKTFNYNSSYNCFFSQQNNILIYPNPTNTQITIRQNFYKPNNYFLNFEIINLSGSILKKGSLKSILENTIILDDFSEGVYLIKLYTNKDVATHKFIIQ